MHALFAKHGLTVFDVDEIPTHGGSLRVYARPSDGVVREISAAVPALLERERSRGFCSLEPYLSFTARVQETKRALLAFLIQARRAGKTVIGYGAAAKGNTLLNYCGVRTDFLEYVVDRSPHKQGKFLPGTHIPIVGPERIAATRPDYVLILPWNLTGEIRQQLAFHRRLGRAVRAADSNGRGARVTNNRVLVTGATGFVGRPVVDALRARGLEVHGVSSRRAGSAAGVVWHQADLLDPVQTSSLVERVRASRLVHLAWDVRPGAWSGAGSHLAWLAASLHLLERFAAAGGRRVVMTGSGAEYDWNAGVCAERTTALEPATLYGTTKLALARVLEAYGRETGLSTAWARIFFTFGPSEDGRPPGGLGRAIAAGGRAGRVHRGSSGSRLPLCGRRRPRRSWRCSRVR